jgi:hypothetical protein
MMLNTYEHGWSDAVCRRPRLNSTDQYHAGYQSGERYRTKERWFELIAVGMLSLFMGVVVCLWVAQAAAGMPV